VQHVENVGQLMHVKSKPRQVQLMFHFQMSFHAIEWDIGLANQARHPQHLQKTSMLPQIAKSTHHKVHCEFLEMTWTDQIDQQVNDILGLEAIRDEDWHSHVLINHGNLTK